MEQVGPSRSEGAVQRLEAVGHGPEPGVTLDRATQEELAEPGIRAAVGHGGAEVEQIVLPSPPEAHLCPLRPASIGQLTGGELIAAAQAGAGVHPLLQPGVARGAAGAELGKVQADRLLGSVSWKV